jgi:hypothetical protein
MLKANFLPFREGLGGVKLEGKLSSKAALNFDCRLEGNSKRKRKMNNKKQKS